MNTSQRRNDTTFRPKTVWIVGASSGIGRALALRLAANGCTVFVSARNAAALETLVKVSATAGRIVAVPLDVTDATAANAVTKRIFDEARQLDLCVLSAGTHLPVPGDKPDTASFRQLLETNVMGTVHVLAALVPAMIGQGGGQIAVISSVAGYRGLPTAAAYGATKAALINMCEALKFDLDRHDIKIQLINPGFVDTPLTRRNPFKMPYLISEDEAAVRLKRALESDRFEISFPWQLAWALKIARCLPYRLYFPLIRRVTGW